MMGLLGVLNGATVPAWSPTYSVQGVLSIPFAEIEEPFAAWANMPDMKSRIDYYGGMVKTFQRGDIKEFGTTAKVLTTCCVSLMSILSICFYQDYPHD